MSKLIIVITCLFLEYQLAVHARTRDITEDEARKLTIQSLDSKARKLPKLTLENYDKVKDSTFFQFAVTWDNPTGSVMVGFFAVNRVTGDVWKLVVCRRLKSEDLTHLQIMIRKQIELTAHEYHQFHDKAPCEP